MTRRHRTTCYLLAWLRTSRAVNNLALRALVAAFADDEAIVGQSSTRAALPPVRHLADAS